MSRTLDIVDFIMWGAASVGGGALCIYILGIIAKIVKNIFMAGWCSLDKDTK